MLSRIAHVFLLFCASLTFMPEAPAQTVPAGIKRVTAVEGITEYALPNGLQVLLIPDASKPTTTVNLTVRVGSRHENYGETGMAHLLEHLIFKGSPKHPNPGPELTQRGMRYNGSTWYDRTNYFASFATNEDHLRWYVTWLSDALVNSNIARKDLDSEMTVVRNEMESGENDPLQILMQKMTATAYQWHNYGNATIGARSDVENVDIDRLRAFYRTYYQPDNATLIIAGRFDESSALKLVANTFGRIATLKRDMPRLYTLDPTQDGERAVTLRRVGGVPLVSAMYHAVPGAHPDFAAFSLATLILGDTPSGRLHKRLVQKGLAADVFGLGWPLKDPGLVGFGAVATPNQNTDALRDVMLATLEGVREEPFTTEEVERARATWLKNWDLGFTDPERVGVALSESIALGDWRMYFLARDRVKAVKREDVQRVGANYFIRDNRTLGLYVPTEKPERAPAPQTVDVAAQLRDFKPSAAATKVEAFEATPANIEQRVRRDTLPNGMKLALLSKGTRGQLVNATLRLNLGDEASLRGKDAAASFVADMLDRGTETLTREQIRDRLDALKARLHIAGGAPTVTVSIQTTRENLGPVLELVEQLLRKPAFKADQLEELRRETLTDIESNRKEPAAIVSNAIDRHGNPYPRGHVLYAPTFDELIEDYKAITVDDLRAFHRNFYGTQAAEFAAVGDFDADTIKPLLARLFGQWTAATPYKRVPSPFIKLPPAQLMFQTPDKANATFIAIQPWPISEKDAAYPALLVANHLLGGSGDGSRLWTRIREKEGLSYGIGTGIDWSYFDEHSTWRSSAIFAPQNRERVLGAWREEIDRVLRNGFTPEEVARGKTGLLRARQLGRAQDAALTGALAVFLHQDRTFAVSQKIDDAISRLRTEDVNAALRRYLNPADFVIAVGGDFSTRTVSK
ncbi:MAG TPA: pitrilysin family protein [Burkholderiaceae bacterium]|nr:pitrilysin family protein [Burkholderiaceae bacterium]